MSLEDQIELIEIMKRLYKHLADGDCVHCSNKEDLQKILVLLSEYFEYI